MFASVIEEAVIEGAPSRVGDPQAEALDRLEAIRGRIALDPERPEVRRLRRAGSTLGVLAGDLSTGSLSDDDLMDLARDAEAGRRLIESVSLCVAGELAARGTTAIRDGLTTPQWLAREGLAHPQQARRDVSLATSLRQLPETARALAEGRIGAHHARVLVAAANPRIRQAFDALVPELLAALDRSTFWRWKRDVADVARLLDQDGPEPDDPDPQPSSASMSVPAEGELDLRLHATGADAHRLRAVIDQHTDAAFAAAQREANAVPHDVPLPPRSELRARAVIDLLLGGHATDRATVAGPTTDATVVLRADRPGRATTPDGDVLDRRTTAELLCDAACTPLEIDGDGVPLRHGRTRRLASPAQRRALAERDGGCTFPGCDAPVSWTRAHHSPHWHPSGQTDLDRLTSACDLHHGRVHSRGWDTEITHDGWTIYTDPAGHRFYGQRHGRRRAGPPP